MIAALLVATRVWLAVARAQVAPAAPSSPVAPAPVANPRVVLTIEDCAGREDAIRAAVAVEVGDLLRERGGALVPGDDQLVVVCGHGPATVEARASLAAAPVRRSLDLGAFPGDAAARALALAALETLAEVSPSVQRRLQSRAQGVAAPPTTPATPQTLPPAAPGERVADQPTAPFTATLSAAWRGFFATQGARLWGARVAVERDVGVRWNAALDLEAVGQSRDIEAGSISVAAVSLGAFWSIRAGGPRVAGLLGAGARAGMVNLSGHPDDAARFASASVIRPWLGPAVAARVVVGFERWVITVGAEGGMTVRGAEGVANDDIAVTLGGPWLAFGAGFGIRR